MFTSGFNANHLNFLLEGALWTVVLSLISFIGGGLGGALVALARISSWRPLRYLAIAYIQIIQGTPLLVILFLSYFGLSIMGLTLPPLVAAGVRERARRSARRSVRRTIYHRAARPDGAVAAGARGTEDARTGTAGEAD